MGLWGRGGVEQANNTFCVLISLVPISGAVRANAGPIWGAARRSGLCQGKAEGRTQQGRANVFDAAERHAGNILPLGG